MIKVIFFDLGNTYAQGTCAQFVNRSYKVLGINKTFSRKEVVFDIAFNKGEIDIEEFFKRFFNVPISPEQMHQLIELWKNNWKPAPEMLELVNALKQNYRLGIISNSDAINSPNYAQKGWYAPFEVLILSHELGLLKPDLKIYEIALEKMHAEAEECLFIDDQEDCLKTARELGMKTILYRSIDQLKKDLKKQSIQF
ncbi:HAD family phosphatase [Candidatus Micrarchaeota archaeon]|nr:HAD family phosphatase [Candidatus Micrarchaeota archaeon]MBU1931011.1 HAD family phosphatase [Candidatus Micrarchaeota archaeon]